MDKTSKAERTATKPKRNYKKWTDQEFKQLLSLREKEFSWKDIAKILDRTPHACETRVWMINNKDRVEETKAFKKKHNITSRLKKELASVSERCDQWKSKYLHLQKESANSEELYKGKLSSMIKEKNSLIKELDEARTVAMNFKSRFEEAEATIQAVYINIKQHEQRKP